MPDDGKQRWSTIGGPVHNGRARKACGVKRATIKSEKEEEATAMCRARDSVCLSVAALDHYDIRIALAFPSSCFPPPPSEPIIASEAAKPRLEFPFRFHHSLLLP